MPNLEPHYPDDVALLAAMPPDERERFAAWMEKTDAEHARRGAMYGAGPLAKTTGLRCWLSSFNQGDSPEDAVAEDADCAADYQ